MRLADRLLCDLRRLPQDLPARRRDGQAAGRFGRRRAGRADARADQVAHHGPHARLRRGDLLLDGLPPERLDDDLLRPRLYDLRGDGPHAHVVRHSEPRAGARGHLRTGGLLPGREGPRQAHRRCGRRRGSRGALLPLDRHARSGAHPSAGVPAVQSLLCRGPHAAVGGALLLAGPQRARSRRLRARSEWA